MNNEVMSIEYQHSSEWTTTPQRTDRYSPDSKTTHWESRTTFINKTNNIFHLCLL